MKATFWGTRGSIPSPSTEETPTHGYGGDTTCVSVAWAGDNLLILDAGSGLRQAGRHWHQAGRKSFTFLFTHAHWDHLQGFPFFAPAFCQDVTIHIYSPRLPGAPAGNLIEKALHAQQSEPFFPAGFPQLRARIAFHEIDPSQPLDLSSSSGNLTVRSTAVTHPGGCLAYRLEHDGKSLVFATDNEPQPSADSPLVKMAAGTDLLICDGQYTEEEHKHRRGWGHGTPALCLKEAAFAGARRLIITHFDPSHSDSLLGEMEEEIKRSPEARKLPVSFARQGKTIDC
ncbi:MAG: MBL fold metallo-hydrolase [Verrucomicrobia bacterium]|nr:MBL fold metallo-hydrolase [Verrucomicrobiota bacterium]